MGTRLGGGVTMVINIRVGAVGLLSTVSVRSGSRCPRCLFGEGVASVQGGSKYLAFEENGRRRTTRRLMARRLATCRRQFHSPATAPSTSRETEEDLARITARARYNSGRTRAGPEISRHS